jgi:hypothetical protein
MLLRKSLPRARRLRRIGAKLLGTELATLPPAAYGEITLDGAATFWALSRSNNGARGGLCDRNSVGARLVPSDSRGAFLGRRHCSFLQRS